MGLMPQIYIPLLHIPAKKANTCTGSVPAARMEHRVQKHLEKKRRVKKSNLALHPLCTVHCVLTVGREVNQQCATDSTAVCHVLLLSGKFLL